ncbi:glycolate oxidase subunit GlcE [Acidiphilium sp.]|uniref:glycolate oxidase subunit GlcE n=1 Tax=Acidiphilium sp. TaxID=527 RepID=UPI003D031E82
MASTAVLTETIEPVANDAISALSERIRRAVRDRVPLAPRGGASKRWHPCTTTAAPLEIGPLSGIVLYEPTELVITALAGTQLALIEERLALEGQYLPFDPPHFGGATRATPSTTLGGMVAAGFAGPGRLGAGGVRNYVLGTKLLNGRAEALRFGGRVIKNVAGFDVARLLVGSMGSLGAITEVSLKTLPLPRAEATLGFSLSEAEAVVAVNRWCGQPLPIAASAWCDGQLWLRLRGSEAGVTAAHTGLGGDVLSGPAAATLWSGLRDQTDPWFVDTWSTPDAPARTLWRLTVPATTPPLSLPGDTLIEAGGATRWLKTTRAPEDIHQEMYRLGGAACWFRGTQLPTPWFTPPNAAVLRVQRAVKQAFDPDGIFPVIF